MNQTDVNLSVLKLAVFLILVFTQPAMADTSIEPLVVPFIESEKGNLDAEQVYKNYSGPDLGKKLVSQDKHVGVRFSLYPEGSVRWIRRCTCNSESSNKVSDLIYRSLAQALKKSKFEHLKSDKIIDATLVYAPKQSGKACPIFIGPVDPVGYPLIYTVENHKIQAPTNNWNKRVLNKIENRSKVPIQKGAIWFRLNKDGSVDSFRILPLIFDGRKISKTEYSSTGRTLTSFVQKATPLPFAGTLEDPSGPRGMLLIADGSDKFKVRSYSAYRGPDWVNIENKKNSR